MDMQPANTRSDAVLARAIGEVAHPLADPSGNGDEYAPLLDLVGDARLVLLGEASHGTHEFYRERAQITKLLIQRKGFAGVAAEADWPDAYRTNRFVRGRSDDQSSTEALGDFRRFPHWMWRNADVLDFVGWLRAHNDALPPGAPQAGFFGMDLYSLYTSIEAVIAYLDRVDPDAAKRARARYACFETFEKDERSYGHATGTGGTEPCEDDVVKQLVDLRQRAAEYAARDGRVAAEEYFSAEQNARLAKNAEEYYRSMFRGRHSSWNLRDRHMAETVDALLAHLDQLERAAGRPGAAGTSGRAKLVLWAHNSHLGDARATEMGTKGELNVGQLIRERYGRDAVLVGFSTYAGSVTAASDWDMPAERKRVRPGMPGSYEALFHDVSEAMRHDRFLLPLRTLGERHHVVGALREARLERAIGVIYRPETERWSHYFHSRLSDQFDAVLHFDRTRAVEPLERTPKWGRGEPEDRDLPETYPFAA
jgi:erythromycin esterase-like protein